MNVKIKGDVTFPGAALLGLPGTDEGERTADWPMWMGVGIAFKPTDKLTFTADAQYTNWKKVESIPMSFTDAGWKAFFESDVELKLRWKNAVQWRFGLEYKLSNCFALRGGFYIDPTVSPIDTHSILLPEVAYNWITFGFGYSKGKVTLDLGVEYGMGKDVDVPFGLYEDAMPGTHGMDLLVPTLALTIRL